ncbi:monovalent cation:proton antiporter-2 (CPA2) family protein [Algihabitans albus]|uniref:monovalent cation:proton antiporter-2 (CPA2) family protein n=1 Tax=Algihabitans albus TaxID=2164067 RepID=UPI0035CFB6C5
MHEHDLSYLHDILYFLLAAVVIVPLARQLRSSPVLGYLAAGVVIGPSLLSLIEETESILILAEFGIVFLLFAIGLELSVERLKVLQRYVFGLGTLQVMSTAVVIALVLIALGQPPAAALVIGGGLALSSTAFVLQMLVERGELAARFGRVAFSILLLQDLAIVPLLALVPLLGAEGSSLLLALGLAALKATAAVGLTLLAGRFLLRPVYRVVAKTRSTELFVATTLLVLLGTGYLMVLAGVSMALGAFLAGLLLSGTEYRHQVEADIRPFRGLLLGLFFMSVGLQIDLGLIGEYAATVALAVLALMLGKALLIYGLCRAFGLPDEIAARVGPLLAQGGEFGFVLVGGGMVVGVVPMVTGQLTLAVVAVTMVLTPLSAWAGQRLSQHFARRQAAAGGLPDIAEDIEDLQDHVVIAGFGRVGQTVAQVLAEAHVPYVGLDLDHDRVRRCRGLDLPVYFGDASQVDVLHTAGLERAKAAVITLDNPEAASHTVSALRERAPEIPIFVRARDLRHRNELEAHGATAVVPETIEASLQLGGVVLGALGASDSATTIMEEYRRENYAKLGEIITPRGRRSVED